MLVVVGLVAVVCVEAFLGNKAKKQTARQDAHRAALRVLDYADKGLEAYQRERDKFAQEYPDSPKLLTLDRYLEKIREREVYEQSKQDELNVLLGQLDEVPRSEGRLRLLQLQRELPGNEEFEQKVRRGLAHLDERKAEEDREAFQALDTRVRTLIAAGEPARAHRLLLAFERAHDGMDPDVKERWSALDAKARTAVDTIAAEIWKRVADEKDPTRQRALLAQAWRALAGTKAGERIGDKLRSAASMAAPRREAEPGAAPTHPGTRPGAAPTVPSTSERLLARAKAAEEMLRKHEWAEGRALLADLAKSTEGGRMQPEWRQRLAEVDRILSLVGRLSEATREERKPHRRLSSGTWKVTAADMGGVTLESATRGSAVHKWSELPDADVLELLTPRHLEVADRQAVALLAAELGRHDAFVKVPAAHLREGWGNGRPPTRSSRAISTGSARSPRAATRPTRGRFSTPRVCDGGTRRSASPS